MCKKILILTIMIQLSFSLAGWAKEAKTKGTLSVSRISGGYTLSIDAVDVMVADILKEVGEKCNVRIVTQGKPLPLTPVSMRWHDIDLDQAVKRIMKVSGVENYLVKHKVGNNKPETIELQILSYSSKRIANTVRLSPPQKTSETKKTKVAKKTPRVARQSVPSGDFKEKVEWFKGNYEWESEETMELAGHLLDIMPDEAKQPGFEELVKSLDKKIKGENANSIDEETLIQAIEGTVPPDMAPMMSKHIKKYIQQFKGEGDAPSEKTPNEIYRNYFENKN